MPYHRVLASLANLAMKKRNVLLCGMTSCDLQSHPLLVCYAGRFLAGLGVGTASLVVPRYLVEIAPTPIRGALGTFSQVTLCTNACQSVLQEALCWHQLHHCVQAWLTCIRGTVATPAFDQQVAAAAMMCDCGLQLFVCVGILIAFAIGLPYDGKEAFLNLAEHQIAWWRVMFAIGLAPATLQVRCRKHTLRH